MLGSSEAIVWQVEQALVFPFRVLEQLGHGNGFPSTQILKSHLSLKYEDNFIHVAHEQCLKCCTSSLEYPVAFKIIFQAGDQVFMESFCLQVVKSVSHIFEEVLKDRSLKKKKMGIEPVSSYFCELSMFHKPS